MVEVRARRAGHFQPPDRRWTHAPERRKRRLSRSSARIRAARSFCDRGSSATCRSRWLAQDDTLETLREKVEVATIIGTIQSMATHFPGLRPMWKQNCEEERLLGVDITGQMDSPVAQDAERQGGLRAGRRRGQPR